MADDLDEQQSHTVVEKTNAYLHLGERFQKGEWRNKEFLKSARDNMPVRRTQTRVDQQAGC